MSVNVYQNGELVPVAGELYKPAIEQITNDCVNEDGDKVATVQAMFDILYPVSTVDDITTYMQAPNSLPPKEKFAKVGIVSDWELVNMNGYFVRFSDNNTEGNYKYGQNQTEQVPDHIHNMDHKHDRGDMNITGYFSVDDEGTAGEAFYKSGAGAGGASGSGGGEWCYFDASRNWTGQTSSPLDAGSGSSKTSTGYASGSVYVSGGEVRPKCQIWNLWKRIK